MIVVHHLNNSRSQRVLWLLEELEVPYEVKRYVKGDFVQPQIGLHLNYVEGELARSTWFAGSELTAADVQMSFPLEAAAARGGLDVRRQRIRTFLERIHGRPAYQRALKRGGPFELLR
jgi:glutathione S-transferase